MQESVSRLPGSLRGDVEAGDTEAAANLGGACHCIPDANFIKNSGARRCKEHSLRPLLGERRVNASYKS